MEIETTLEYQLGSYIGEYIYYKYLPTLSVDSLQSPHVIKVSDEEEIEAKRLHDVWWKSYDHKNSKSNKVDWDTLQEYHKMLELKYIPQTLECYVRKLTAKNINELKEGIRDSLWNTDLCHYNLDTNDDIVITNEDELYSTIITLKYQH
jgi:hypothetical protein